MPTSETLADPQLARAEALRVAAEVSRGQKYDTADLVDLAIYIVEGKHSTEDYRNMPQMLPIPLTG